MRKGIRDKVSFKIDFPYLPFFQEEMIATLLACEQSCRMLVALLVSTICIRVGELTVAGLLDVAVVTNGQICTCSEGWSEINRIKYCTFLVYQTHFLFE